MEKERILIIVPAYNEEECIEAVIDTMIFNSEKYDSIIINDGSSDGTKALLENATISSIHLISNLGIGGAMQTGYKYAYDNGYDIAVQFDGDNQHDIDFVATIISPLLSNEADMVIGSRFIGDNGGFKSSKARQLGIGLISFVIKLMTGKKIYDTTSGFRAINRKVISEFANYYPHEYPEPVSTTFLIKKRYRVVEVPVKMNERVSGRSSIRSWKSLYFMFNVILSIVIMSFKENK